MTKRAITDVALLAYPTWWRDRYGAEVARLNDDLVADGRSPIGLALDLARGGIVMRITGAGMPEVGVLWRKRSKWLVAIPSMLTVLGSFLLLTAMTDWWSHVLPRRGATAQIATDLWTTALVAFWVLLMVALAAWRIVLKALGSTAGGRSRWARCGLYLPFALVPAEFGLSVLRSSLGSHMALGPHAVQGVDGAHRTYAVMVTVSDHPLLSAFLTATITAVAIAGTGLFIIAIVAAVRRVSANATFLIADTRIGMAIGWLCGVSALTGGAAGAMIMRAGFLPGSAHIGTSLPWWWWPCTLLLFLLSAGQLAGTRAARRCYLVAERFEAAAQ